MCIRDSATAITRVECESWTISPEGRAQDTSVHCCSAPGRAADPLRVGGGLGLARRGCELVLGEVMDALGVPLSHNAGAGQGIEGARARVTSEGALNLSLIHI
eukprot:2184085-Alexandrium_andersonii.AAC.1